VSLNVALGEAIMIVQGGREGLAKGATPDHRKKIEPKRGKRRE